MLKRFLSGAIIVVFTIPMLVFSNTIVLNAVVGIISALCVYEALGATKYVESKQIMFFAIVMALTIPFVVNLSFRGIILWLSIYTFVMFILAIINYKYYKFEHMSVVYMLSFIIPYFFANIVFLRRFEAGEFYIFLIFIGAWFSDTFALAGGMLFGKHKLCPQISPKKTVEGAIGGVIGAIVGFFIFGLIIERFFDARVSYLLLMLFGALSSIAAQIGDLSGSLIKRAFGVKDFGNLIPGHGGMLDRFDSVLFVAPFLCTVTLYCPFIWHTVG